METTTTHELSELPLDGLVLDPIVNRSLDERWAQRIADSFNPDALGLFVVWGGENRSPWKILDGQHRKVAASKAGWTGKVACRCYRGLTDATAADLFLQINAQRNVSAIDKFRKAVQAGHPRESAVAGVLTDFGYVVGTANGELGSPTALLAVHTAGGAELLRQVIDTLTKAFPDEPVEQALSGEIVSAVLYVLKRYGKLRGHGDEAATYRVDLEHLQRKLTEVSLVELYAERDLAHRNGPQYSKGWHLAAQLVTHYNHREGRATRLEQWAYKAHRAA